jgi:hypothetical protein
MPRPGLCRIGFQKPNRDSFGVRCGDFSCGIVRSPESQVLEEIQQPITWTVTRHFALDGLRLGEQLLFYREVGVQIDLSGFDGFVPQPKRNQGTIDAGQQKFHRCSVTEHMWRNAFLSERRADFSRGSGVFRHQILNSVRAKRTATLSWKQEFGIV